MSTTIGISLYKKSFNYVKECVESALNQTTKVKVILRTDGEDACDFRTLEYLRNVNFLTNNFTLIEGKNNLGIYGSYKEIFKDVDTENICQLDADDYLHQDAIRVCEGILNSHPEYWMVYTDCIEIDEQGNHIQLCERQSNPYTPENIRYSFMTFHLRVIRKEIYDKVGGFDENVNYAGDYDLSLKISEIGNHQNIGYIPLPLYYYRRDDKCHSLSEGVIDSRKDCYAAVIRSLERTGCDSHLKIISNNQHNLLVFLNKITNNVYETLDPKKSQPIILTGMHRSFTSLTSSMLNELGIFMGNSILSPDIHNPEGYYENEDFLHLDRMICQISTESENSFPDWGWSADSKMNFEKVKEFEECAKKVIYDKRRLRLWGWKDPRTSLLLDFWDSIIPHAKYIFIYRHPGEVYESVLKLKGIQLFQDHPEYIEQCWRDHNQNIIRFAKENRDKCLVINSNNLTQNPNKIKPLLIDKFNLKIYDENLEHLVVKKHIRSKRENVSLSQETLNLYNELEILNELKE
jgi:glycosyltransferase involved in cell wall biosynthesis